MQDLRMPVGEVQVGVLSRHSRVVARGLAAVLRENPPLVPVLLDDWPAPRHEPALDVVIFDVYSLHGDHGLDEAEALRRFTKDTGVPVVALDRPLRPDLAATALAHGGVDYVSLESEADRIVRTLLRAAAGGSTPDAASSGPARGSSEQRLHVQHGLTPAEVVTLRLIAAGLSNHDIATECYVSINTVKSRVRAAYRRLGITTRAEAVRWALQHGLASD
jgi:DNA-binding NarL/FixJ family response regulator